MEACSVLLALCAGNSPVAGEFPAQRPVTRSFDVVFFDLRLNKHLSKQWWGWWFETPSRPLWRHCNVCLPRQRNSFEDQIPVYEIYNNPIYRRIAVSWSTRLVVPITATREGDAPYWVAGDRLSIYSRRPIYRSPIKQDCFLQKEAMVCVSNAFVIEDSKFKWYFLLWKLSKWQRKQIC